MTALYLAGPMRGIPDFNVPAFDDAAKRLRAAGYTVFSPPDYDREQGFDHATGDVAEFNVRAALKADLSWIADNADGVAVLTGWENSRGARAEVALAEAVDIPVRPVAAWLAGGEA